MRVIAGCIEWHLCRRIECKLARSFIWSDFDPSFLHAWLHQMNPVLGAPKSGLVPPLTGISCRRWVIICAAFFLFHFDTVCIIHNGAKSHIHMKFTHTPRVPEIETIADCTCVQLLCDPTFGNGTGTSSDWSSEPTALQEKRTPFPSKGLGRRKKMKRRTSYSTSCWLRWLFSIFVD